MWCNIHTADLFLCVFGGGRARNGESVVGSLSFCVAKRSCRVLNQLLVRE